MVKGAEGGTGVGGPFPPNHAVLGRDLSRDQRTAAVKALSRLDIMCDGNRTPDDIGADESVWVVLGGGGNLAAIQELCGRCKAARVLGVRVLAAKPSLHKLIQLESPCISYALDGQRVCLSGHDHAEKKELTLMAKAMCASVVGDLLSDVDVLVAAKAGTVKLGAVLTDRLQHGIDSASMAVTTSWLQTCWRDQEFHPTADFRILPLWGKAIYVAGLAADEQVDKVEQERLEKAKWALQYMGASVHTAFSAAACHCVVAPNSWAVASEQGCDVLFLANKSRLWIVTDSWVWACVRAAKYVRGEPFLLSAEGGAEAEGSGDTPATVSKSQEARVQSERLSGGGRSKGGSEVVDTRKGALTETSKDGVNNKTAQQSRSRAQLSAPDAGQPQATCSRAGKAVLGCDEGCGKDTGVFQGYCFALVGRFPGDFEQLIVSEGGSVVKGSGALRAGRSVESESRVDFEVRPVWIDGDHDACGGMDLAKRGEGLVGTTSVSEYWVRKCAVFQRLLQVHNVKLHQPIDRSRHSDRFGGNGLLSSFHGRHMCLTGLHGAEKRFYKWFITAVLGARCHNDFSRKKTEFLIAKPTAVESEKMQMARKHGVPVQPLEWLEAKVEEECTHTQSLPFMPDPSQLHSTLGSTAAVVTEGNFTRASLQADGREADAAVGDGRSESDDSDGDPAHKFAAKLRARLISDKSSGSPRVDGQMQDKQGLQGLRQDWKNGGGALANADPGVGSGGKAGGDGEEIVEETEEEVDETDAEQEGQGGHPRLRDLPFKSGQQSACALVKSSRRVNIDGEDVAAERAQMARSRACPPPSSPPSRAPRTCMAPSVTSSLPRRRGCRGRPGEGSKGTMHGWGEVETKSESPGGSMCGLARADGAGSVRKRRRAAACVEALDSGAVSEAAACAKAGGGETERKWHDAGAAVTVQGADESQADAMQLTGRMAGQRSRRAGRDETPERERKVSAVGGGLPADAGSEGGDGRAGVVAMVECQDSGGASVSETTAVQQELMRVLQGLQGGRAAPPPITHIRKRPRATAAVVGDSLSSNDGESLEFESQKESFDYEEEIVFDNSEGLRKKQELLTRLRAVGERGAGGSQSPAARIAAGSSGGSLDKNKNGRECQSDHEDWAPLPDISHLFGAKEVGEAGEGSAGSATRARERPGVQRSGNARNSEGGRKTMQRVHNR